MIQVRDDGIGISQDDIPFIFDAFHRGSEIFDKEGSGLGLAEVKAIVNAHGGRITVESEPGRGAVFTIYLPKTHADQELKR